MPETWQHKSYDGTLTDAQGNQIDAWADPVEVPGCMFDPGGSSEPGFQARVITEPTLYIPHRAVTARDLFVGRGDEWQVNGDVGDWDPALPVIVPLRRVEG